MSSVKFIVASVLVTGCVATASEQSPTNGVVEAAELPRSNCAQVQLWRHPDGSLVEHPGVESPGGGGFGGDATDRNMANLLMQFFVETDLMGQVRVREETTLTRNVSNEVVIATTAAHTIAIPSGELIYTVDIPAAFQNALGTVPGYDILSVRMTCSVF